MDEVDEAVARVRMACRPFGQECAELLQMSVNNCLQDVVLGLEVVVDVAAIDPDGIDDVGKRSAVITALLKQQLGVFHDLGTGFIAFAQHGTVVVMKSGNATAPRRWMVRKPIG